MMKSWKMRQPGNKNIISIMSDEEPNEPEWLEILEEQCGTLDKCKQDEALIQR